MQISEKNIGIIYSFDYFSCDIRPILDWIERNPRTLNTLERCVRGKHAYFLKGASILNFEETVYGLRVEWTFEYKNREHHCIGYWSRNGILKGYIVAEAVNGKVREGEVWEAHVWYMASYFRVHWKSMRSKAWDATGLIYEDRFNLSEDSALLFLQKQLTTKMSRADRKRKGLTV